MGYVQANTSLHDGGPASQASLEEILKGTSRAFYLSLAILPPGARTPLSLAYLIARAADTVADAPGEPGIDRPGLLTRLKTALGSPSGSQSEPFSGLRPEKPQEAALLAAIPRLLGLLAARPAEEARAIRDVVSTLIDGMVWDQSLFADQPTCDQSQTGLESADLETYTYLVAGCVGPFWSWVCAASDPRLDGLIHPQHHDLAVEFGKGLQWVNILRDIPKDQEAGRFYLPRLGSPLFANRFLAHARRGISALSTASSYPRLFPASFVRHRVSVFWPLVLGLRTLEKLLADGGPKRGRRIKVSRAEVFFWLLTGPLLVLNDTLLTTVLEALANRANRALKLLEASHVEKSL